MGDSINITNQMEKAIMGKGRLMSKLANARKSIEHKIGKSWGMGWESVGVPGYQMHRVGVCTRGDVESQTRWRTSETLVFAADNENPDAAGVIDYMESTGINVVDGFTFDYRIDHLKRMLAHCRDEERGRYAIHMAEFELVDMADFRDDSMGGLRVTCTDGTSLASSVVENYRRSKNPRKSMVGKKIIVPSAFLIDFLNICHNIQSGTRREVLIGIVKRESDEKLGLLIQPRGGVALAAIVFDGASTDESDLGRMEFPDWGWVVPKIDRAVSKRIVLPDVARGGPIHDGLSIIKKACRGEGVVRLDGMTDAGSHTPMLKATHRSSSHPATITLDIPLQKAGVEFPTPLHFDVALLLKGLDSLNATYNTPRTIALYCESKDSAAVLTHYVADDSNGLVNPLVLRDFALVMPVDL
jgi:hypothetical protein